MAGIRAIIKFRSNGGIDINLPSITLDGHGETDVAQNEIGGDHGDGEYERAQERVERALSKLEASLRGLNARIRSIARIESDVARLEKDRAMLASELGRTASKAKRLDESADMVSRRLVLAMEEVKTVLEEE